MRVLFMGVGDHERCDRDHVDQGKDCRDQTAVLRASYRLAVLAGISDPRIDAFKEMHVEHNENGQKNTGERADVLSESGEYFRKEKKQHRAGAYKQHRADDPRYRDLLFLLICHLRYLN